MHWMMEFFKPVNMKDVQYAKKLLRNPVFKQTPMNNAHKNGDNYIIKNVEVMGYSVKDVKTEKGVEDKGAVFFVIDSDLIQLGKSYYPPLRFSVPKSQIVEHETDRLNVTQDIEITEWAYHNCYMLPINKLYEDWGRMMRALNEAYKTKAWDEAPMYLSSCYRNIIEDIYKNEMRELIKNHKNTKGGIYMQNKKDDNGLGKSKYNKEPFREEAEYIFYTDGSGNWANDKKHKDKGHFSVYLKNTQEKWKRKEDKLTGNQAELLGVMSAVSIASKRNYKRVTIFTDSMNVVNWANKKPDSSEYIWNAKHPNIAHLVERLREMTPAVPLLAIKHIPREKNFAHAI